MSWNNVIPAELLRRYADNVKQRNGQYRRLEMSRNKKQEFSLEVFVDGEYKWQMSSDDRAYLQKIGAQWVDGGFIDSFRVV
jgi:hypothetical protein